MARATRRSNHDIGIWQRQDGRQKRRQPRIVAQRLVRPAGQAARAASLNSSAQIDLSVPQMRLCRKSDWRAYRVLFAVVVKDHGGFSSRLVPAAWSPWPGWRAAGWSQVREWLVRRAGVRGVRRPRWSQGRSPVALPGPLLRCWRPGGVGAKAGVDGVADPALEGPERLFAGFCPRLASCRNRRRMALYARRGLMAG
jgi:hypothetical protein